METSFFKDVHDVARLIPNGRVTSYGAIANYLGLRSSARMVGWAMNECPSDVPAHRVVNRIGLLTGKHKFAAPNTMQQLLEKEGVKVKEDQILNFESHFWDPFIELEM